MHRFERCGPSQICRPGGCAAAASSPSDHPRSRRRCASPSKRSRPRSRGLAARCPWRPRTLRFERSVPCSLCLSPRRGDGVKVVTHCAATPSMRRLAVAAHGLILCGHCHSTIEVLRVKHVSHVYGDLYKTNSESSARQFFTTSFLGENAAVLAGTSGNRPQRHAIEQASRRWRGGRCDDSARTRLKF